MASENAFYIFKPVEWHFENNTFNQVNGWFSFSIDDFTKISNEIIQDSKKRGNKKWEIKI